MALVVTGTAIATRITMMAAATISSIRVNPAYALRRVFLHIARDCMDPTCPTFLLLNGDYRLRTVHQDRLHGRIAGPAPRDRQRRLPAGLCHERQRYHRALSGNPARIRRTRRGNLQGAGGF